jgi:hypothetical protein
MDNCVSTLKLENTIVISDMKSDFNLQDFTSFMFATTKRQFCRSFFLKYPHADTTLPRKTRLFLEYESPADAKVALHNNDLIYEEAWLKIAMADAASIQDFWMIPPWNTLAVNPCFKSNNARNLKRKHEEIQTELKELKIEYDAKTKPLKKEAKTVAAKLEEYEFQAAMLKVKRLKSSEDSQQSKCHICDAVAKCKSKSAPYKCVNGHYWDYYWDRVSKEDYKTCRIGFKNQDTEYDYDEMDMDAVLLNQDKK